MMNKMFYVLAILMFTQVISAQHQDSRHYAVKSGFIKYELTGNIKGTKLLYWDNYGEKTREEIVSVTEVNVLGINKAEKEHTVTITDGDHFWSVDLIENTGQKGTLEIYDVGKQMTENMSEADAKKLEDDIMSALNGHKLGKESFLGKSCDIYEVMGAKSWIYKGVALKTTAKMMGVEANEIALEFNENSSPDNDLFVPIANIDYQDFDEMTNSMLSL
ncbi:hypothetical protein [Plebeiibacterium sediminum]|uniref:DUF4412 domain-containing protein n=1 Tax=Plebeiibacterium sediminum TaxID=2992112 RepID=A0AAE3M5D6_9BACT|nr:hypothetical protein [Plebeiobacterium sediminum]MCW3787152.1 hypothetical protein [Plebeiobacterium sediminum]